MVRFDCIYFACTPPPPFLEVIFTFLHLHQLEVEHLMPGLDLDLNSGQTGSFAFSQTNELNFLSLFLTGSTVKKTNNSVNYTDLITPCGNIYSSQTELVSYLVS